ncbi:MAG: EamA family transporter [Pseudomonadota bacterium]
MKAPSANQATLGYLFTFTAASLWALLGPVSRIPLGNGISPMEVAFWRAFFGALCFVAHAVLTKQYRVSAKDSLALAGFGVIGIAAFFTFVQVGVQRSGAAMTSVLLYTGPFWVALFSRIFFKERLTPLKMAAIVVAMAGVALLCLSGGSTPQKHDIIGILFGLLSGLAYSTHYVFNTIYLKRFSSITIYAYCLTVGCLVLLPFIDFVHKSPEDWLALMTIGVISSYGAYSAYCEGLKRLAPTKVAVLSNLEPLLTTVLAFVFWGELFPLLGWFGAGLVLVGIFMVIKE